MSLQAVLLPVFVLVTLTFVLLVLTGRSRVGALKRGDLRLRDIALGQSAWPARSMQYGRAYQNQFELPLLFYILVGFALFARKADLLFVVMSWIFVALRLAHAYVHVTSNHVPLRFRLFLVGMLVLALMWLIFAVRVLAAL